MVSSVSVIENSFTIKQIANDILRNSEDIREKADGFQRKAEESPAFRHGECQKEAAKWKAEAIGLFKAADMLIVEMTVKNGTESGWSKEKIIQEIARMLEIDIPKRKFSLMSIMRNILKCRTGIS